MICLLNVPTNMCQYGNMGNEDEGVMDGYMHVQRMRNAN